VLLALCGLSACVAQPSASSYGRFGPYSAQGSVMPTPAGQRVAVLVPLSGPSAELGRSMLQAARLALNTSPDGALSEDTKGTPEGAAAAAQAAAAAGAGIFVGPLTAGETAAVSPIARARNIPVLAFTSDTKEAQPGIWPLGLTPGQQVRALVRGAARDNKRRIGAVLPQNPFGDALADGLVQAASEAALPPPLIVRYPSQSGPDSAIAQVAGNGGIPDAPPAIDALMLGTTADVTLRILPALVRAGLGPDRVRLLGTALWGRDAGKLAPLAGAWFAGPSAQTLKVFADNYMAHYGTPPRDLASVAFDAAGAARAITGAGAVDVNTLLNPNGFSGANGVFVLLPDGRVRRSLTLFEIGTDGARPLESGLSGSGLM